MFPEQDKFFPSLPSLVVLQNVYSMYMSEVCGGLKFVSGSRQGVEISARLPARLPDDLQRLVPAWSRGKKFLSSPGPACPSRPGFRESRIWSSIN